MNSEADRSHLITSTGRLLTASLFVDVTESDATYPPIYCMSDRDEIHGFPSAYHIYMNSVDEYEAAMKLVGSLRHWRKLCEATWFMKGDPRRGFEGLEAWRQDMTARDFSVAKGVILSEAKHGDGASARKLIDISSRKVGKTKETVAPVPESPEDPLLGAAHERFVNGG